MIWNERCCYFHLCDWKQANTAVLKTPKKRNLDRTRWLPVTWSVEAKNKSSRHRSTRACLRACLSFFLIDLQLSLSLFRCHKDMELGKASGIIPLRARVANFDDIFMRRFPHGDGGRQHWSASITWAQCHVGFSLCSPCELLLLLRHGRSLRISCFFRSPVHRSDPSIFSSLPLTTWSKSTPGWKSKAGLGKKVAN